MNIAYGRALSQLKTVRQENLVLQRQLVEVVQKLAELESNKISGEGLFQKVVEGLVALGVPGLVLLVAVSVSGYAGAAALTSALASLGGPFGMVGGVAVLLLLVLVSRALARYGLPRIARAVVRGLIAKGDTPNSIRQKIDSIPKWIIAAELRRVIIETLQEATTAAA